MKTDTRTQGFTLVEILVAIALLGILAAVLTATLTGALGLNRQAQKQLDTTSQVQGVLENVRNAWAVQDNYDKACAPNLIVPAGYTVKFVNLSSRAEPLTTSGKALNAASCPTGTVTNGALVGSPAKPPVMRRVTVQSGTLPAGSATNAAPTVGPQDVSLTLDILRPE